MILAITHRYCHPYYIYYVEIFVVDNTIFVYFASLSALTKLHNFKLQIIVYCTRHWYTWDSHQTFVAEDLCLFFLALCRFIDRGEFGEVYQGTAIDILGPDTGPTPVAVKVRERLESLQSLYILYGAVF